MTTSSEYFDRACQVIPGGVNSPVRAFNGVGGTPIYVNRGSGARITTVEGTELLDFCGSWGPLVLGHAREEVVEAVREAAGEGMSFGINTPREVAMAELIHELVPYIEQSRLVSSGTEAVMTALRLARGITGRSRYIKFDGCYHGHSDNFLVAAGSGLLTGGQTSSAGVAPSVADDVFVLPYNDLEAVRDVVNQHGDELAAIVIEPMAGNMGLIPPADGYLTGLRELCDQSGAMLVFDEVICGFRLGATTFGHLSGVTPDITCLGKIIGGGLPIGAIGGSRQVMEHLSPCGDVYQAGTLSGNPVAVAAGLKTLELLRDEDPYSKMAKLAGELACELQGLANEADIDFTVRQLGGMFTPFFRRGEPRNLDDVKGCDTDRFAAFFHGMLKGGVYLSPSQFELDFVSAAHRRGDIDFFLETARQTFSNLKERAS